MVSCVFKDGGLKLNANHLYLKIILWGYTWDKLSKLKSKVSNTVHERTQKFNCLMKLRGLKCAWYCIPVYLNYYYERYTATFGLFKLVSNIT